MRKNIGFTRLLILFVPLLFIGCYVDLTDSNTQIKVVNNVRVDGRGVPIRNISILELDQHWGGYLSYGASSQIHSEVGDYYGDITIEFDVELGSSGWNTVYYVIENYHVDGGDLNIVYIDFEEVTTLYGELTLVNRMYDDFGDPITIRDIEIPSLGISSTDRLYEGDKISFEVETGLYDLEIEGYIRYDGASKWELGSWTFRDCVIKHKGELILNLRYDKMLKK